MPPTKHDPIIVRAYMAAGFGRGGYVRQRYIGYYADHDTGIEYEVWESDESFSLTAMVRFKPITPNAHKRCKYMYDPGNHWRRANRPASPL